MSQFIERPVPIRLFQSAIGLVAANGLFPADAIATATSSNCTPLRNPARPAVSIDPAGPSDTPV